VGRQGLGMEREHAQRTREIKLCRICVDGAEAVREVVGAEDGRDEVGVGVAHNMQGTSGETRSK
jgi:hypothetical protein